MEEVKNISNDSFVDKLKDYFANTPREEIEAEWNKTEEFDNVGVSIDVFLDNTEIFSNYSELIITKDGHKIENYQDYIRSKMADGLISGDFEPIKCECGSAVVNS